MLLMQCNELIQLYFIHYSNKCKDLFHSVIKEAHNVLLFGLVLSISFSQSSESEKNKMPLRLSSLSVNTSFKLMND